MAITPFAVFQLLLMLIFTDASEALIALIKCPFQCYLKHHSISVLTLHYHSAPIGETFR